MGLENVEGVLRSLQYGSQYYGCFMLNTLTQKDTVPPGAFDKAVEASAEIEALYQANLVSAAGRDRSPRRTIFRAWARCCTRSTRAFISRAWRAPATPRRTG